MDDYTLYPTNTYNHNLWRRHFQQTWSCLQSWSVQY